MKEPELGDVVTVTYAGWPSHDKFVGKKGVITKIDDSHEHDYVCELWYLIRMEGRKRSLWFDYTEIQEEEEAVGT